MVNLNVNNFVNELIIIAMQCKGLSDNYWVVSIRENPQQIR